MLRLLTILPTPLLTQPLTQLLILLPILMLNLLPPTPQLTLHINLLKLLEAHRKTQETGTIWKMTMKRKKLLLTKTPKRVLVVLKTLLR